MNRVSVYDFSDTGFRQILGLLLHSGLHPKIGNVHSQTAPAGAEDTAAGCQHLELSATIQCLADLAAQVRCPPSSFLELTSMQMGNNGVTCDLQPPLNTPQLGVSALVGHSCKGHFSKTFLCKPQWPIKNPAGLQGWQLSHNHLEDFSGELRIIPRLQIN